MREVYLDNAASTAVDEQVVSALLPYLSERYGNPSSLHQKGIEAERGVVRAREQVATAVAAAPNQVFFTSGGTEANAIGILGARGRAAGVVASAIEHPSALGSAQKRAGAELRSIPIRSDGRVDADEFAEACTAQVAVATCMLVSNELG